MVLVVEIGEGKAKIIRLDRYSKADIYPAMNAEGGEGYIIYLENVDGQAASIYIEKMNYELIDITAVIARLMREGTTAVMTTHDIEVLAEKEKKRRVLAEKVNEK